MLDEPPLTVSVTQLAKVCYGRPTTVNEFPPNPEPNPGSLGSVGEESRLSSSWSA